MEVQFRCLDTDGSVNASVMSRASNDHEGLVSSDLKGALKAISALWPDVEHELAVGALGYLVSYLSDLCDDGACNSRKTGKRELLDLLRWYGVSDMCAPGDLDADVLDRNDMGRVRRDILVQARNAAHSLAAIFDAAVAEYAPESLDA